MPPPLVPGSRMVMLVGGLSVLKQCTWFVYHIIGVQLDTDPSPFVARLFRPALKLFGDLHGKNVAFAGSFSAATILCALAS